MLTERLLLQFPCNLFILGVGLDPRIRGRDGMRYEAPKVVDYGSIAEHTFTRCPGGDPNADIPKDFMVCEHDKHGECSCGETGLTP